MDKALILDEKVLKRIPPVFVFFLILILGLPAVALNYFGVDFGHIGYNIGFTDPGTELVEQQLQGYFRQTLLQWTAFSLAAVTVLLSFTQYRLTNDKIALIIGLAVLFSGTIEALQTLVIDGITSEYVNVDDLNAIIWTIANTFSAVIFIIGLLLLIRYENAIYEKKFRVSTFILLTALLVLIAFSIIYYTATRSQLPEMWFEHDLISRPYETIYLLLYLFIILFIYPKVYQLRPYILTNCIFYMAATQIIVAIYMMLLSDEPYDSGHVIASFLNLVVYFIPFSCFIVNYIYSYNSVLEAQEKLKVSEAKLKHIAAHDPLTNLYNRREFETLLDRTIANSDRTDAKFALFVIDIDNFKTINDTFGHLQGDRLLKQFTDKLKTLTRKGDLLSRIGGDEFTLITSQLKSPTAARKLAERIIKGLSNNYNLGGKNVSASVSIGISLYPMDGETTEKLLKNADIAMYSAKKSGKNTYRFYTEELSHLQQREIKIETHLRQALHNDELSLYYLPTYNLVTREIIGAEVLLRWHNAVLGDVSPDEFIPVAENTGLIHKIGRWVLEETCEQAQEWFKKYHKYLVFSINVSAVQFDNLDFIHDFEKIIEQHQYPAKQLSIEIPENLLMKNIPQISRAFHKLNTIGVNIAIDDFGMGYTSLRRLRNLPIETVKIDKTFVSDIHPDSEKVIVIDTIIKLASELEMNVVSEGIETDEQLNYLVSKKCYLGQGYFLSKPIEASAFESLAYKTDDAYV